MQERINEKKEKVAKITFSDEKLEAMKSLAQQIAKSLGAKPQSGYRKELEEERKDKLESRAKLKSLTPLELRKVNRKQTEGNDKEDVNKYDGHKTKYDFDKALKVASRTATVYSHLKHTTGKKHSNPKKVRKRKNKKEKIEVDNSGMIDGERVEGLMKTEVHRNKKENDSTEAGSSKTDTQDNYVLETLLSKKGRNF